MHPSLRATLALAAVAAFSTAASAAPAINGTVNTFAHGDGGWVGRIGPNGTGLTFIEERTGQRKPSLRTQYDDFLKNGLRWYNDGRGWTGNYAVVPSFTFGVDVDAFQLSEGQNVVTRDLWVYFLDTQHPPRGYDSISVGVKIGTMQVGQGWQRMTVTIPDTTATELPAGWVGTGATDADGNPMLPKGRTFAEVMSHVDEIAIQTGRQANVLLLDAYDVAIDNPYITAECPGATARFSLEKTPAPAAAGSPFQPCN
jgi:hypothetical protein